MPASGAVLDSTHISMRPVDIPQTTVTTRGSLGTITNIANPSDDREIFKSLHDCMKDMGKFRQYIYYLGTSCDTTKLRNKIQKLKARINRSFYHQQDYIRNGVSGDRGPMKNEVAIRRFENFLCFTLASINYYEDLLHKYSILFVHFPLATGEATNVVSLGFEDSTINAEEASFQSPEVEDNETNRYIELLNQIQFLNTLRDEIEQIDFYQLRHQAPSYSKDFVDNMHKHTTELISRTARTRNYAGRRRYRLRNYFSDESTTSVC